ncbi:MAG: beta-ketoacyl-[acyl-carrier-protein] synthase II, partial [Bacteroidetes bacterium]|nr:beta-ketoacyl-[acyl-carrier-protein] synthase II [Bacteroidota bacterium]
MAFSGTQRRVVVTGMGVVSPVGISLEEFWKNLVEGNSGAGPITQFDASEYDTKFACEVKDFDPLKFMDRKLAQRTDRFTHFGMVAADLALKDSGLDLSKEDRERIGVIFGSGIGGMWTYHKQFMNLVEANGPRHLSPFFIPMLIPDIVAGRISMQHGLKGPNYATASA